MKWLKGPATAALACAAFNSADAASWVQKPALSDEFNSTSVNSNLWTVYHNQIRKDEYKWDNVIWHSSMVVPTSSYISIKSTAHSGYYCNAVDDMWNGAPLESFTTYMYLAGGIESKTLFGPNTALTAVVKLVKNLSGNSFSFWLASASSWPPELDVFEFPRGVYPNGGTFIATSHYGPSASIRGSHAKPVNVTETNWNTYKITWSPSAVAWTLNGVEVHRVSGTGNTYYQYVEGKPLAGTANKVPSATDMRVMLNSAVGIDDPDQNWFGAPTWNTTTWNCEMQVDKFLVSKYE